MIQPPTAVDSRETGVTTDASYRASAMIVDTYPRFAGSSAQRRDLRARAWYRRGDLVGPRGPPPPAWSRPALPGHGGLLGLLRADRRRSRGADQEHDRRHRR